MSTAPPIEPPPAGLPTNRGCWKGALLGCGGVAILLVVGFVAIGIYVQNRPAAVTDLLMERIRAGYAPDVTEEDKSDLEDSYADFRAALEARRVGKEDVERVRDAVKLGGQVDRREVQELTRVFRQAAGSASAPDSTDDVSPAPAATPLP